MTIAYFKYLLYNSNKIVHFYNFDIILLHSRIDSMSKSVWLHIDRLPEFKRVDIHTFR
jgi:hypothetical protein